MTFEKLIQFLCTAAASSLCLCAPAWANFTVEDESSLVASLEEVRIDGDFATEESRNNYALIIYNSDYTEEIFDDLEVAKNDAEAMRRMFLQLGYRAENVVTLPNLSKQILKEEIAFFAAKIDPTKSVVVYYSGHGVTFEDVAGLEGISNRNFLVPPDMRSKVGISDPVARTGILRDRAIDLSEEVLAPIKARNPNGLVVFYDACRDTALSASDADTKSGLRRASFVPAQINGSAIFYSARPGETAVAKLNSNDKADLSLYTRVLISTLSKAPATRLRDLNPAISQQVSSIAAANGETQRPTWSDSLNYSNGRTEFCLAALKGPDGNLICTDANGQVGARLETATTCEGAADLAYWDAVKTSLDKDTVQSYLDQCPSGTFRKLAEKRVSDIRTWTLARQSENLDQVTAYLSAFPNALFRSEAEKLISDLEPEQTQVAVTTGPKAPDETIGKGVTQEIPEQEKKFWLNAKQLRDETTINIYISMSQSENSPFTGVYLVEAEKLLSALAEEAADAEEDALWESVRYSKSVDEIEEYMRAYPEGRFVADAERRIDELVRIERDNRAWARAERRDSLSGYEIYFEDFPNGLHAQEASARIEEIEERHRDEDAWAEAERRDNLIAYRRYEREFPNGLFSREAKRKIEELDEGRQEEQAWAEAKRRNTIAAYNSFFSKFRSGKYASDARDRIRALNAEKARAQEEEKRRKEKSAWETAQRCGTSKCYSDFARRYPSSSFASTARNRAQCPIPVSSLTSANRAKHVVQNYYEALNDKRFNCAEKYWAEMKPGRRNLIWDTAGAKVQNITVGYSSGSQTRVEAIVDVRSNTSSWERWKIHMDVSTFGSSPKITDMGGEKLR